MVHRANLKSFCILVFILVSALSASAQFKVIGYYPMYAGGYPTGVNSLDLNKITHLYLAFANPDGAGNLIPDYGTTANITTVVNAAHAKGLKIFLSIGGGGASGTNYQTMLSSAGNISTFVTKITTFANTYNLDGIDVDIEGNILNGTTLTAAQYQSFVTSLGTSLHANGKLMSSALGSWFGNFVTNTAAAQFDWINMMSYDLCGPWSGACQHAPYSMTTSDFTFWNSTKGVPASKLVVGLPFYGYGWGTMYNPGITYCSIVNTYPGAENADQVGSGGNGLYYNGINTIKQKTTYAKNNAAGVMIWELTQDCATSDSRSLLLAVSQVLGPLPLTWLDFKAQAEAGAVNLQWATTDETNNAYFVVERSADGKLFEELQRVSDQENTSAVSTYVFIDVNPLTERNNYYRIKQVDQDGTFSYSDVATVNASTHGVFRVYPNPAENSEVHIQYSGAETAQVHIQNVLGEVVLSKQLSSEKFTLAAGQLKSGVYLVSLTCQGQVYYQKLTIR